MSVVSKTTAISLTGLAGTAITVEAAVSQQLPGMAIIGLPDAAIAESKHRVKVAVNQAGLKLSDRFVTVNLSPAEVPKHGSSFDLAIALAALAASGQLPPAALGKRAYIGELGLAGELRRPHGLLSQVIAAKQLGFDEVMVPASCANEASLVPGIHTLAAHNLREATTILSHLARGLPIEERLSGAQRVASAAHSPESPPLDMRDIQGQGEAIYASAIAAAGGHHMMLTGPPGAGKTMLAARLPTILPDLADPEALEVTSIASLGGRPVHRLLRRPPFEAPHHTASSVSIIGGGSAGRVAAGAVTRASHGVLFLDEAPEFSPVVLDALRQPLESGEVHIDRAGLHVRLPGRVQLVLAANPCACGNAGSAERELQCTCTPAQRRRYHNRISGPLLDRIDIRLKVHRVQQSRTEPHRHTSAELRARVSQARARAHHRYADCPWSLNSEAPGTWLRQSQHALSPTETTVLDQALQLGQLTLRGYDRVLRLAWSIADFEDRATPSRQDIAQALGLRNGLEVFA